MKDGVSNEETVKTKNTIEKLQNIFLSLADFVLFATRFLKEMFLPPYELQEIINQAVQVGYKSLFPVSITSFIMGIVIVLQSRPSLVEFGAGSYIPAMSAITTIREVGPLITALICGGNIGSGMCAELGSMRVTEQIDAMEVCGGKPFKFLVVTRVIASALIIPLLVIHSDAISLFGAYTGANINGVSSLTLFFNQVFEKLTYNDVIPSMIKSVLFGFTIGIISCYKGYTAENGTAGVGRATNSAVVISLILIIVIDMVVAQGANIFNLL